MEIFTFGVAKLPASQSLSALLRPPTQAAVPGLVHAECMTAMRLGAAILSPDRLQLRNFAMFAAWENEAAIDDFLAQTSLGQPLGTGWHLRMSFLRRWGSVRELADLPELVEEGDPQAPVAAYTLARMKIPELPRFIRYGRPVEELVRDHPESTLAMAAIRYPRSVATFSIWTSQQAMTEMVKGNSPVERPERHPRAMKEYDRRSFHHEFATMRFKPLSEHGTWQGRSGYVPLIQPA